MAPMRGFETVEARHEPQENIQRSTFNEDTLWRWELNVDGRIHWQTVSRNQRPLANPPRLRKDMAMTRERIEAAVAGGIPFTLRMADGKEYRVPHRDYISLPPKGAWVIVYDDHGRFTVLPLLTMTGLEVVPPDADQPAK